jgi:hypothetical protein
MLMEAITTFRVSSVACSSGVKAASAIVKKDNT